jgi:membrane protease YdiL (CAAX protease family)
MTGASLSVIINLAFFRSILSTFLMYHIFICLVVPVIDILFIKKQNLKYWLKYIGIVPGKRKTGIVIGFVSGIIMFMGIVWGFRLFDHIFLANNTVSKSISAWGIEKQNLIFLFLFMVLFNGAAEELFWRGYIHKRLEPVKNRFAAISLASFFYASYHSFTLYNFINDFFVSMLFLFFIFLAGCFWGWLREHYQTVIPAVTGHVFATIGYMTVAYLYILPRTPLGT